jgi:arylsulfatase A-like enzyme
MILPSLLALGILFIPTFLAAAQPNIVYILADDLGYGDLSCYGQDKFETPHIDSLAKEGLKFTNHYSGNTVCSPSRAVLMTGVHSGKCYLRGNVSNKADGALPSKMTVLPEIFKQAGYRTGAFGKWGLGFTNADDAQNPLHHGFDEYCGWKNQSIAHTYFPTSYIRNGKEIPLDGKTYVPDLNNSAARDFIRQSAESDTPFLCYLPTAIPHAAMHAPAKLHEKWRKKYPQFDDVIGTYNAGGEPCPDVRNPIAGFAAMMEYLDNSVGRLLTLLDELDIADNTIVMFASDNGAHKEGGHRPAFWNSTGGLRGFKRDMHEGGIRSPFLVRWPGNIKAGTTSDHLSGFQDILATVCELLEMPIPPQNTGLSMLPTLRGNTGKQAEPKYLVFEFRVGKEQKLHSHALRFGDWKAYRKAGEKMELFNLAEDPWEKNDLANDESASKPLAQAKRYLAEGTEPLQDQ